VDCAEKRKGGEGRRGGREGGGGERRGGLSLFSPHARHASVRQSARKIVTIWTAQSLLNDLTGPLNARQSASPGGRRGGRRRWWRRRGGNCSVVLELGREQAAG
jgi:hypothetical protein